MRRTLPSNDGNEGDGRGGDLGDVERARLLDGRAQADADGMLELPEGRRHEDLERVGVGQVDVVHRKFANGEQSRALVVVLARERVSNRVHEVGVGIEDPGRRLRIHHHVIRDVEEVCYLWKREHAGRPDPSMPIHPDGLAGVGDDEGRELVELASGQLHADRHRARLRRGVRQKDAVGGLVPVALAPGAERNTSKLIEDLLGYGSRVPVSRARYGEVELLVGNSGDAPSRHEELVHRHRVLDRHPNPVRAGRLPRTVVDVLDERDVAVREDERNRGLQDGFHLHLDHRLKRIHARIGLRRGCCLIEVPCFGPAAA